MRTCVASWSLVLPPSESYLIDCSRHLNAHLRFAFFLTYPSLSGFLLSLIARPIACLFCTSSACLPHLNGCGHRLLVLAACDGNMMRSKLTNSTHFHVRPVVFKKLQYTGVNLQRPDTHQRAKISFSEFFTACQKINPKQPYLYYY
jgi:hypothetical protein